MFQVYVFFLVLCGGLSLISVLGDFVGADVGELDADLDLDFDADVDMDADVGIDADADADDVARADMDAEKILSMRGLMYTLFGFGLTGTALSLQGLSPAAPVTIGVASGSGLAAGWVVTRLMGWLKGSQVGERAEDATFEGRFGRMVLSMSGGSRGRVRVTRGERTYDLRALPHPSAEAGSEPGAWTDVMVVEVKDGLAYVVPTDDARLIEGSE